MSDELERALEVLAAGGVVAAATETLFGLLADVTSPSALDRLAALKPRAPVGVPVLLPSREAWSSLVPSIPEPAARLADAFWPGPLTIVLEARAGIDERLLAEGTLGVRWPGASPAAELAARLGRPLTATSANLSGEPPAARAEQVRSAFAAAVEAAELFVVEQPAPAGAPSTVIAFRSGRAEVVRIGAISLDQVRRVVVL